MRWCVWVEAGRPSQVTCRSMTPAEGADPLPGQRSVGTKRSHPLWTAHLTATWWSGPITVARSRLSNWLFLCLRLRLQRAFQPVWTNDTRLLINRELKSLSPQVQKRIQLFFCFCFLTVLPEVTRLHVAMISHLAERSSSVWRLPVFLCDRHDYER